jgi:hypothetical protein
LLPLLDTGVDGKSALLRLIRQNRLEDTPEIDPLANVVPSPEL